MKVAIAVKMRGQTSPYDEWLSRYENPKNQQKFLKKSKNSVLGVGF